MIKLHRVRPAAQADIDDSAEYLAADSLDVGQRFLRQVNEGIEEICEAPELGAVREFNNPRIIGLRARPVKGFSNWRVYYLVADETVEIVRVLHGARDLERLFSEED